MKFLGSSAMARMVEAFDWDATPLGPIDGWPASLKTAVSVVLNSTHPMFLFWGAELTQIYNDAYLPSFGVGKHPAALGQRGRDCWPEIWPLIGPEIEHVFNGGMNVLHEDALIPLMRNGRIEDVYWTYTYSAVYGDDDRVGGVLVTCMETTERVKTARAVEATAADRDRMFEAAPVAIAVLVGPELTYQLANSHYCKIIGRDHIVGKPFAEVYPELVGSPIHAVFQNVYASGTPYSSHETRVELNLHGRMQDRYYDYNLAPLRTSEGEVYGFVVIVVDITQQVLARSEVERLNVELKNSADTKDAFLAMLGHELRNPLAPIVTALRLMKLKDSSTSREQKVIERQVEHMLRLVDDLLDVSKITRGKVLLRLGRANLSEVVAKAVEMAAHLVEQKQHELVVDVPDELPWFGDAARLTQVIANLLTNAARYTPHGGHIEVRAGAAGDQIELTVSDNGLGISPALQPKIFDLFAQGHRNVDRAEGGLGLGLALVKSLVELHHGSVRAESRGEGKGSTFTVLLPSSTPKPTALRSPPTTQPEPAERALRVLLVDDNQDAADTLGELLRLFGHQAVVVYGPTQALEAVAAQSFDVAILDIGLPGLDGHALAERIRASAAGSVPRLIALTGYGQPADKQKSQAAGFAAHLVKPVDPDALLKLLQA